MLTRGITNYTGYYRDLNNPKHIKTSTKTKKKKETSFAPPLFDGDSNFIKKEINYQIMKSLKFSLGDKRKSPTVVIRIGITLENFNKLKFDYNLTGSFKANRRFKKDYIIYQKRFFPEDKTSSIKFITFKIRKFKDLETFSANSEILKIPRNCQLSVRYMRDKL